MNSYDEIRLIINKMAEVKMAMNSHKGNIEDLPVEVLSSLISAENMELKEAIAQGDMIKVIEEAADIHNYLTAAVFKAVQQYRGRKGNA